ncbi:tumor necrosis factor receptor superfamily member 1B-like isoform X4 [Gadus macrocephalus]|uniref:tumor necrosis factor receptor superfamily member 1B-like isoform X4 n=1 Tax=Gadus macrocephalus TaxID=80720 RepID=UPI0028CB1EBF|nr:tumor necrosis factor receptor superfamily member 1B-like isoform X4 [Gadus macrocephalus]
MYQSKLLHWRPMWGLSQPLRTHKAVGRPHWVTRSATSVTSLHQPIPQQRHGAGEQGLVAERECTREQDSACTVLDGFYCQEPNQKSGCTLAQKHTQCNASQMTKLPGTRGTDTVCEDCKTGYYSTPGLKCTEGKSSCGNGKVLQKGSQTKETVCNTAPRRHHYDVILSVMLLSLHG